MVDQSLPSSHPILKVELQNSIQALVLYNLTAPLRL